MAIPRSCSSAARSSQPSSMTLSETQSGSSLQPRMHSSRRSTSPPVIQSPVESEISSFGAASRSAATAAPQCVGLEALEAVGAARVHVHRDGAGLGDLGGVARELVRRQREPRRGRRAAREPLRQRLEEHRQPPPAAYSTIDLSTSHSTGALSSV